MNRNGEFKMDYQFIDATKLYASFKVDDEMKVGLVFYEKDTRGNMLRNWIWYDVVDKDQASTCFPYCDINQMDQFDQTEILLYHIALYFFNKKELDENDLMNLKTRLMQLYNDHQDDFLDYIEEMFSFVKLDSHKYFYSSYLIKELVNAFNMINRLYDKDTTKDYGRSLTFTIQ